MNFNGFDPVALVNKKYVSGSALGVSPLFKFLNVAETPGTRIDFNCPISWRSELPRQILLIGCGGTGSHLLPNILQYCWSEAKGNPNAMPEIILCDADVVEEKNLVRQKFTRADVGLSKAEALARRYSSAFGVRIRTYNEFIKDPSDIANIFTSDLAEPKYRNNYVNRFVIGAVDNHRARMLMWLWLNGEPYYRESCGHRFWIDSGNETWHGQAILGMVAGAVNSVEGISSWEQAKIGSKIRPVDLPSFFEHFPDDFSKAEKAPLVPQNECAIMVEENPQTIQANMMSAFCATGLFVQAYSGEIRCNVISFDALTCNTRPLMVTRKNIMDWSILMAESRKKIKDFLVSSEMLGGASLESHREWSFLSNLEIRQDVLLS